MAVHRAKSFCRLSDQPANQRHVLGKPFRSDWPGFPLSLVEFCVPTSHATYKLAASVLLYLAVLIPCAICDQVFRLLDAEQRERQEKEQAEQKNKKDTGLIVDTGKGGILHWLVAGRCGSGFGWMHGSTACVALHLLFSVPPLNSSVLLLQPSLYVLLFGDHWQYVTRSLL